MKQPNNKIHSTMQFCLKMSSVFLSLISIIANFILSIKKTSFKNLILDKFDFNLISLMVHLLSKNENKIKNNLQSIYTTKKLCLNIY